MCVFAVVGKGNDMKNGIKPGKIEVLMPIQVRIERERGWKKKMNG